MLIFKIQDVLNVCTQKKNNNPMAAYEDLSTKMGIIRNYEWKSVAAQLPSF